MWDPSKAHWALCWILNYSFTLEELVWKQMTFLGGGKHWTGWSLNSERLGTLVQAESVTTPSPTPGLAQSGC